MLKTGQKQALILIIFCILMWEILTLATLSFVSLGLFLTFFNIKTTKIIRNALALGVFASYWLTYGKIIDPEIGLNFLTSIIILKIMEKDSLRDDYMIFFGLLLIISAGSLFERSITYVFFFAISFMVLIREFYSSLGQKFRLRDLSKALLWTLPLTFILFFFVPRLLNPIPFQQNQTTPGEVGYTPDVNISNIDTLASNQNPVFQVLVNRKIDQGDLYWRGNTLSYNDGWNWPLMVQDKDSGTLEVQAKPVGYEVNQSFRLYGRPEYFFALDIPRSISYRNKSFGLNNTRSLQQRRWQGVQRYTAISDPRIPIIENQPSNHYLQTGLTKSNKEMIKKLFKGDSVQEVNDSIRAHFLKNKFTYSLSPGRSTNLQEFLDKKVGFCSHYASAVALILRVKGIPTRLVSGYMGGRYNRFADFYLISENDAHVWVEAFSDGRWQRLDPTEWIAPDRVLLGGEAYAESVRSKMGQGSFFKLPTLFRDLQMRFDQWDFIFYQWLEEMDYTAQDAWLSRLKIKREWLFSIIPLILVLFMLAYTWYLSLQKSKNKELPYNELWRTFFKKMEKRGVILSPYSIQKSNYLIEKYEDEEVQVLWNELLETSFKNKEITKNLKTKIRNL